MVVSVGELSAGDLTRSECEYRVRQLFTDPLVANWLLNTQDSLKPRLHSELLSQSMFITYSIVVGVESIPDDITRELAHAAVRRSRQFIVYQALVVPHWILGNTVLATLYTENRVADLFFPDSDVLETTPLTRVVVDLSHPDTLELANLVPLSNGQSMLGVSEFPRDGGYISSRILLDNTHGRSPVSRDILRWIRLVESIGCQFCLLRKQKCACSENLYYQWHPPADDTVFSWAHWVTQVVKMRNRMSETALSLYHPASGAVIHRNTAKTCMGVSMVTHETRSPLHLRFFQSLLPTFCDEQFTALGFEQLLGANRAPPSRVVALPVAHSFSDDQPSNRVNDRSGVGDDQPSKMRVFSARVEEDAALSGRVESVSPAAGVLECREIDLIGGETRLTSARMRRKETSRAKDPFDHVEMTPRRADCGGEMKERMENEKRRDGEKVGEVEDDEAGRKGVEGGRKFECETCNAKFARKYDMMRHVKAKHLDEREFGCDLCGKRFKQRWHLDTHIQLVHDQIKTIKCSECGSLFGTASNMRQHMRLRHPAAAQAEQQSA